MLSRGPIRFVLRYSFFVAACAPALAMETSWCLGLPAPSFSFLAFQYCATLMAYNLYYVRHADYLLSHWLAGLGAAGAFVFGLWSMPLNWPVLALLCLAAMGYVAPAVFQFRPPKALLPLKPALLAAVWALATVYLLPRLDVFSGDVAALGAHRFVMVGNLCLLFFFRDEGRYYTARVLNRLWSFALLLQALLAVVCGLRLGIFAAEAFLCGTLLCQAAGQLRKRPDASPEAYLLLADGIMLVQPIFVALLKP